MTARRLPAWLTLFARVMVVVAAGLIPPRLASAVTVLPGQGVSISQVSFNWPTNPPKCAADMAEPSLVSAVCSPAVWLKPGCR